MARNSQWRFGVQVAVWCVGLGALPAVVGYLFAATSLRQLIVGSLYGSLYATCIGVPCWLFVQKVWGPLERRSRAVRTAALLGILAAFGVLGCIAANLILVAVRAVPPAELGATIQHSMRICLLITFTGGLLTKTILSLQTNVARMKEELHKRQVAEEVQRKIAAEARYSSLVSRVHPHFLFNTLNSISALVRENPAEAERMIERLAALLRFSLDSEHDGVVPLREELRVVSAYLEIEKVRFGGRLRYRMEVGEDAGGWMIPALAVQTLVENSVKFAVGTKREGAEIIISAAVAGQRLRVQVGDDGPGFADSSWRKPGHGLDLLERRLTSLFGDSAALEVGGTEGHAWVAFSLPA